MGGTLLLLEQKCTPWWTFARIEFILKALCLKSKYKPLNNLAHLAEYMTPDGGFEILKYHVSLYEIHHYPPDILKRE